MIDQQLKQDLDKFMEERMAPIRQKMIEQERKRYEEVVKQYQIKGEKLSDRTNNFYSQIITLEGVIVGAVVLFMGNQSTIWVAIALILLVVSIVFGIWSQRLSLISAYWIHQFEHKNNLKSHWWTRELWGDDTVKTEKEIIEPHLEKEDDKKELKLDLLKILHLNADKVEKIFIASFIIALLFFIVHIIIKIPLKTIKLPMIVPPINKHLIINWDYLLRFFEVLGVLGATVFSAISVSLTKNIIDETKKQNYPDVVVFVNQKPGDLNTVYLTVKNEGKSVARNIKFNIEGTLLNVINNRKINDILFIKNGIHILASGQEISNPLGIMLGEQYNQFKNSNCKVKIKFDNSEGKIFEDSFLLDFNSLRDVQIGRPWHDRLVNAVEDVSRNINKIKNDLEVYVHKFVSPQVEIDYPDDNREVTEKLDEKN